MLLGSCAPLNAIQQTLGLNADRAPPDHDFAPGWSRNALRPKQTHDVRCCDFAFAYTFRNCRLTALHKTADFKNRFWITKPRLPRLQNVAPMDDSLQHAKRQAGRQYGRPRRSTSAMLAVIK